MNPGLWCIRNNRTAIVAFLFIAMAGGHAFRSIPRLEDPEFTIRVAVVTSFLPGAAPQKVEELITDKLEKKIQEMAEVKALVSQSMTGLSVIEVEVHAHYREMQPIWSKLRNKIEDIRPFLPEGAVGPFVNDEFGDVFPVVLALTGDGFSFRELKDAADMIRDRLLTVEHMAKVSIFGVQEERIFVEFSNARLAEFGVSPYQVADLLKSQNVLQSGGSALLGPERVTIEATGEFQTLAQIRKVSLRLPGRDTSIALGDIAEVRREFVDPPGVLTRFNGKDCLMLAAGMSGAGKVTEFGEAIKAEIERMRADLAVGLDCDVFIFQPKFVERAINDFTGNLQQAFLFVVIVMLLFCGWRTGLIVGALVPLAMLLCLTVMPVFGIKLHSVSIASLIIALGMLVDNGIVMSENILVRLGRGEERAQACGAAARELWLPLLTSSLTTIAAFLPIALAKSDVGEYCRSLFQVVSLTLLASWLLSLTFTPMVCYYFLKASPQRQSFKGRFYAAYRVLLIGALRRPVVFLTALAMLLGVSCWAFRFVPSIFFPPNEREMLLIDFWQPYGTDISVTAQRSALLEKFLLSDTNVASVGVFVGEGGPRWYLALNIEQENPNYANIIINLHALGGVNVLAQRLQEHLAEHFPDCRYTVKKLETGPPVGAPIQLRLTGSDTAVLYQLRDRLAGVLAGVAGVVNVRDNWGEWTKKLVVDVNQEQAKQAGFSSQDIALSLQAQISGLTATEYREGREVIPIILRSQETYRGDLGRIESLNVYSYATQKSAPLLQLARARLEWQTSNIRRRNALRTMTVMADMRDRFASDALAEIVPKVQALTASADWPAGYAVAYAGEDAESAQAQASIMDAFPLAAGLLILILIAQFNSIRRPLIILLTIPPMLIGVVPGLLLTNAPFGFMAFLGLISLMGIIVNNAIVLIDRMEIERAQGCSVEDAIILAAHKRLRPILATATTTVVGLVPLALQGGEMWRPMANTIIFGLVFATILTLGQCPVLYAVFFRASFKNYRWNPDVLQKSSGE